MRTFRLTSLVALSALVSVVAEAAEPQRPVPAGVDACGAPVLPVVAKAAAQAVPTACAPAQPPASPVALRAPAAVTPAYTPRFLPGFAVTFDRAQAVWTGFVSGVGRSLSSGRNCFTEACGPTGTPLGGSSAPGPGVLSPLGPPPPTPTLAADAPLSVARTLPSGVPDVAGVTLAYGWRLSAGPHSAPFEFSASAGRNVYRWNAALRSDETAAGFGVASAETADGHSLALSARRGDFALEVAQHRLEFAPRHALATDLADAPLRRRDVRLGWHASRVELSASWSESATRSRRDGAERAWMLGFTVPLD